MSDSIIYASGDYEIPGVEDPNIKAELQKERSYLETAFSRIERWANAGNAQIKFALPAYNGTAGGAAVAIEIVVADGGGVPNPFATVAGVTVVGERSVVLVDAMPLHFVRTFTDGSEKYVATLHVTDAIAEGVTLELRDSEATDLSVISTCLVTFA
jgi:hypothetical protein